MAAKRIVGTTNDQKFTPVSSKKAEGPKKESGLPEKGDIITVASTTASIKASTTRPTLRTLLRFYLDEKALSPFKISLLSSNLRQSKRCLWKVSKVMVQRSVCSIKPGRFRVAGHRVPVENIFPNQSGPPSLWFNKFNTVQEVYKKKSSLIQGIKNWLVNSSCKRYASPCRYRKYLRKVPRSFFLTHKLARMDIEYDQRTALKWCSVRKRNVKWYNICTKCKKKLREERTLSRLPDYIRDSTTSAFSTGGDVITTCLLLDHLQLSRPLHPHSLSC